MHGLTGGDWKRAATSGNRASPRPSQFVIMRVFGLVGGSDSSGGGLVPASPSGPVQLCRWCGQLPGQAGEQAADLVAGQRDQLLVVRVAGGGLAGQDGQEGVDEQGQDGPPVPGGPGPDLVLVQGGQFLAASKTVPRLPPRPGDLREQGKGHRVRGVDAVERQLAVADPAALSRFPGEEPA